MLQGNSLADMSRLVFRDPNHFQAGDLHRHTPQWLLLLDDLNDDHFSEVNDWIANGVNVTSFLDRFKGSYKGKNYECSIPPSCVLPITFHAHRLPHLYLICSWTICVLGLFPSEVKLENAPHLTSFYLSL